MAGIADAGGLVIVTASRIILDACCMINIHACGRMADILSALPAPIVLSEVVRSRELLSVQSLDALNPEGRSFRSIVGSGVIEVLNF